MVASSFLVPKLNSCFKIFNILFLLDFPLTFGSFEHALATLPPCLVYYNVLIVLQPLQLLHFIFLGVIWLTHLAKLPNIWSRSPILTFQCLPKSKQTNNNKKNIQLQDKFTQNYISFILFYLFTKPLFLSLKSALLPKFCTYEVRW